MSGSCIACMCMPVLYECALMGYLHQIFSQCILLPNEPLNDCRWKDKHIHVLTLEHAWTDTHIHLFLTHTQLSAVQEVCTASIFSFYDLNGVFPLKQPMHHILGCSQSAPTAAFVSSVGRKCRWQNDDSQAIKMQETLGEWLTEWKR